MATTGTDNRTNFPHEFSICPACGKKGLMRLKGGLAYPPSQRCKYCHHRIWEAVESPTPAVRIERRFSLPCGFVYVGDTRVGFATRSAMGNEHPPSPDEPIVVWRVRQWRAPTPAEVAACIAALAWEFPGREIRLGGE